MQTWREPFWRFVAVHRVHMLKEPLARYGALQLRSARLTIRAPTIDCRQKKRENGKSCVLCVRLGLQAHHASREFAINFRVFL